MSKSVLRYGLLAALLLAALVWWRISSPRTATVSATPTIEKQAVTVAVHTFDPAAPPAEMPVLSPLEAAATDSNFVSNAAVVGESEIVDATHAIVTVTGVRVNLQLKINIWIPVGATAHVIDHEQGHRQISEYYYRNAGKIAEQIAARYIRRQFSAGGTDLDAEIRKLLQQKSADITAEYNDKLNVGAAQQRYDDITDHSRNDIEASEAVTRVLKDVQ